MKDQKKTNPVKEQMEENKQENPVFRSHLDRKINQLEEGFAATHQLDDLREENIPTVCDDGSTPLTDDLKPSALATPTILIGNLLYRSS